MTAPVLCALNGPSIAVLVVAGLVVAGAVIGTVLFARRGKGGCGCADCPSRGHCDKRHERD